jgi:sulfur-carrier protein
LAVHGATVSDVLKDAAKQHPAILRFIVDDGGRLHSWIRIYSGEEDVAVLEGLDTPVADGELVHVIPCILD